MAHGFVIYVTANGRPLPAAQVRLLAGAQETRTSSDAEGCALFDPPLHFRPDAVVVTPYASHWETKAPRPVSGLAIDCLPLPMAEPTAWWHRVLGARQSMSGKGIRVGVVDSGCGPHPFLDHVRDVGRFIDGDHSIAVGSGEDISIHGTHVCGILAARPRKGAGYVGIAPGIEIYSAAVFSNGEARQGDVANPIEWLVDQCRVDLINLSLSVNTPSAILADSIQAALEQGVLCLCAVGNTAGAIEFPASLETTVGVGAIGRMDWGPPTSTAASWVPKHPGRHGRDGLYLAAFSCVGRGLDAVGPGLEIISTVPARFGLTAPYAVMRGTSMACPAVTAVASAILAADPVYLSSERTLDRADLARERLRQCCRDIGLERIYQGWGLPRVSA